MAIFRKRKQAGHQFRLVGTLLPPPGADTLTSISVGPEGPVALWSSPADGDELLGRYEGPGGATFAETRTRSQPRVSLVSYTASSLRPDAVTVVDGLPVAHPLIQPLPDGGFIVVGARCAWRAAGPEKNALVVGPDGHIEHAGTLGDGIEHMLLDDRGDIWIGYFDEGIFGNFGWGVPGPEPLGSAGIVRWSSRFEKLWEYQAVDDYWLADCYAMNVGQDGIWACPYTDFPILQIKGETVSVQQTSDDVRGPSGLVVAGDAVGIIGDYTSGAALLLGSLADPSKLKKSELGMPDGRHVPPGVLICRGSAAHLFVGADWFVFDLADAQ